MKGHIATIHEGKKEFKCDICTAEFTSKQGMKAHITHFSNSLERVGHNSCSYQEVPGSNPAVDSYFFA